MATSVLLRLAALTGEGRYAEAAEGAHRAGRGGAGRPPDGVREVAPAIDWQVGPVDEVAIVGDPDRPADGSPRGGGARRPAHLGWRPRRVMAVGPDPAASVVPLLQGRFAPPRRPTAFVCRNFACRQPVTEPEALAAILAE